MIFSNPLFVHCIWATNEFIKYLIIILGLIKISIKVKGRKAPQGYNPDKAPYGQNTPQWFRNNYL